MEIKFLSNGYDNINSRSVGQCVINSLKTSEFHTFTSYTAFVTEPGINRILEALIEFHNTPSNKIDLLIGIDEGITSVESLNLLASFNESTAIYYNEYKRGSAEKPIYHPKIYIFEGDSASRIIIGSSNLTTKGLFSNIEGSLQLDYSNSNETGVALKEEIVEYFNRLKANNPDCVKELSSELIKTLKENGYIESSKERFQNRKTAPSENAPKVNIASSIFAAHTAPSIPPRYVSSASEPEPSQEEREISTPDTDSRAGLFTHNFLIRENENTKERQSGMRRLFTSIVDYTGPALADSILFPCLDQYATADDSVESDIISSLSHNMRSHSTRFGIISKNGSKFELTPVGKAIFDDRSTYSGIFKQQMLKYFIINDHDHTILFPYRAILRIIKEVKVITKLEFIFCIYPLRDTNSFAINTAIENIYSLRSMVNNLSIQLQDDIYKEEFLETLNFKFSTSFTFKDVWGPKATTVYNQFNYFRNNLLAFDEVFMPKSDSQILISLREGSESLVDSILEDSKEIEVNAMTLSGDELYAQFINHN